jgi:hypothetical protein
MTYSQIDPGFKIKTHEIKKKSEKLQFQSKNYSFLKLINKI